MKANNCVEGTVIRFKKMFYFQSIRIKIQYLFSIIYDRIILICHRFKTR